MGLRVAFAEIFRPSLAPKTDPPLPEPAVRPEGGFQNYLNAISGQHRPGGGEPPEPPVHPKRHHDQVEVEPEKGPAPGPGSARPTAGKGKSQKDSQDANKLEDNTQAVDQNNADAPEPVTVQPAMIDCAGLIDLDGSVIQCVATTHGPTMPPSDDNGDVEAAVANVSVRWTLVAPRQVITTPSGAEPEQVVTSDTNTAVENQATSDASDSTKLMFQAPTANSVQVEPVSDEPVEVPAPQRDEPPPVNTDEHQPTIVPRTPKNPTPPSQPARAMADQKVVTEALPDRPLPPHLDARDFRPSPVVPDRRSSDAGRGGFEIDSKQPSIDPGPVADFRSTPSPSPMAASNRPDASSKPPQVSETKSMTVVAKAGDDERAGARGLDDREASVSAPVTTEQTHVTAGTEAASSAPHTVMAVHASSNAVTHAAAPSAIQSQPLTSVVDILMSSIDGSATADTTTRVVSSTVGPDRHHATLQLEPPELGDLRIAIHLDPNGMRLRVDADSADAARLIESRLPELRDALAVHGIRMDRSDVVLRAPNSTETGAQHHDNHRSTGDRGPDLQSSMSNWRDDGRQPGAPRQNETRNSSAALERVGSEHSRTSAEPARTPDASTLRFLAAGSVDLFA